MTRQQSHTNTHARNDARKHARSRMVQRVVSDASMLARRSLSDWTGYLVVRKTEFSQFIDKGNFIRWMMLNI